MPEDNREYEKLKKDYEDLQNRYDAARAEAVDIQKRIALAESSKAMRFYRKVLRLRKTTDPFTQLRPVIAPSDQGLKAYVDSVSYKKGDVVIRGWAHDIGGGETSILLRDRSRIVEPSSCIRYPRPDANDLLGLKPDACTGFTIKVPVESLKHQDLSVEFMNEYGYYPIHVDVLVKEEEREDYLDVNAHPVYCIDSGGYNDWLHDHLATKEQLNEQRQAVFSYQPCISIVIPLFNTPEVFLDELVDCILAQTYRNFELCLADGSTEDAVENHLKEKYLSDKRIIYKRLTENKGISENTNAAIAMAHGDFIMLCDHDDTIEPDTLYELVKALNTDDQIDVLYTDEDKMMLTEGIYFGPNFKSDWNPDFLCTNNYITHIFCARKKLVDEIGGERSEYDGSQDYDFIFRCCEKARKIYHVPKILYHWRAHSSSTAGRPESKMYAYEHGCKAIQDHYGRVGIHAKVEMTKDYGSYRSIYQIEGEPLVSIIIPNKDLKESLERTLNSIYEKSTYRNFEVIIAENNSTEQETFDYYTKLQKEHDNLQVITWNKAFNYSAINNYAVKSAKGEYLIFLNNDVEVITDRWIEEMLGYCLREDVGACGVRLYYPNDTLQHCGIVVGIGGIAGHICQYEKRTSGGYFGRVVKTQDVSAVTAACMMTKKSIFTKVGGFEESFTIAYNDVDYCLKIRALDKLVVYDAWALLYHYESLSRGSDEEQDNAVKHKRQMKEAALLRKRWPDIFRDGDPYFNPNLDYMTSDFILKGTIPPNYTTFDKANQGLKTEKDTEA